MPERYIPGEKQFSFTHNQVGVTTLDLGDRLLPHLETVDFPVSDPWSRHLRGVIVSLRTQDAFRGQNVTEFGIGDGRNIRAAGPVRHALGVDIERWRVEVGAINLKAKRHPDHFELWTADAVEYLQVLQQEGRGLQGWVIMCLPQSPEGVNTADSYDHASSLDSYRRDWERSGLTLNAAVLTNLKEVADRDLRALIILSDRVPDEIRMELFAKTGWEAESFYTTKEPIQQDPDTGIHWVAAIDDGKRFFERVNNHFESISAVEAETRRKQSLASGLGRQDLNAYHGLTVYRIKPK